MLQSSLENLLLDLVFVTRQHEAKVSKMLVGRVFHDVIQNQRTLQRFITRIKIWAVKMEW